MVIIAAALFPSTANSVAPDFPGNITAVATTSGAYLNGSVTVRWSAVTGATAYAIKLTRQASADDPITGSVNGQNNTELTINGLLGGATYVVQVRTVQVLELSAWSPDTLTTQPKTSPKAPGAPTSVAGNSAATVSWTKVADSDNGGFAISSYVVKENESGRSISVVGTLSSAEVTGLTRGSTATFTVTAINAANTAGTTSLQSDSILLPDVPGSPVAPVITAVSATSTINVTWTAPTSNGGDALTGYTVNIYKESLILSF